MPVTQEVRLNDAKVVTYPKQSWELGVEDTRYPYGHIQRYGAFCDGIVDDTTQIQNCLTNVGASGRRGIVTFPNLPTKITSSLIITDGGVTGLSTPLIIRGAGQGTQIINAAPASNPTFKFLGISYWRLEDMLLTGNSTNPNDGVLVALNGALPHQCARFTIKNVITQTAGRGIVLSDTNTGTVRDCKHWPSSNSSALTIAQTVSASDISHGLHMTGGFCNDISIYDFDSQPSNSYATGFASIKLDATNSSGIRVFAGLMEGSGAPSSDKHAIDFAHCYAGLVIVGVYAENNNIKFSDCRDGILLATDGQASGDVLITGSSVRMAIQGGNHKNLTIDSGCSSTRLRDTEFFGTITDNGTATRRDNVTNAGARVADTGNAPITFRVKLASGAAIASGADTQVIPTSFTGGWDDYNTYSISTGKFTPGVIGKYRITVIGNWASVTAGAQMFSNIKVNGTTVDTGYAVGPTGGTTGFFLSTIVNLTAVTDFVTFSAQNGDSASRTLVACAFMAEAL